MQFLRVSVKGFERLYMRPYPSPGEVPPKGKTSLEATLRAISRLRLQLNQSKQSPPLTWYERLHATVIKIVKYVGIPGVIIAAIGPVQKVGQEAIDYYNKRHIQRTYVDYATVLLNQHAIERANKLLTTFESRKDFDPKFQYYKAKILIAMAIQQGRNYDEAFDTANILIRVQETGDWFFPSLGGVDELLELTMALVDIHTALQRYTEAKEELLRQESNDLLKKSPLLRANLDYRWGVLALLQYDFAEARKRLEAARTSATQTNQGALAANTTFQLAKAHQFSNEHTKALELYEAAEKEYRILNDQFGLLRTYNNMAMIYFDLQQDEEARKYYNFEQTIARRLGDELGYARATANISLIEKRQGNYESAVRLSLEALGIFKQQSNLLGMSTTAVTLSNSYDAMGNTPEAISYAKQALATGLQLRELRAVATACGSLANVYNKTQDEEEGIFSSLCALTTIRYLRADNIPGPKRDYGIFVSAIKGVKSRTSPSRYSGLLASAEKRVVEIVIGLNLEKTILNEEVQKLR